MVIKMELLRKLVYFTIVVSLIFSSTLSLARADDPENFANCRLGAGGVKSDVVGYDLEQLNLGLYLDWQARSSPPPGLPSDVEYIQMVRVHQDKGPAYDWFGPPRQYASPPAYKTRPSLAEIADRAASLPGSLWLIGNEIERVDWYVGDNVWGGQDEITPEVYATAFHDIQTTIRAADPTARIAMGGGIIEPTPLRLEYLDRIWDSYYAQYGYSMGNDIDVWHIHIFILMEKRYEFGADIPAGLDDTNGFLSEYDWTTPAGWQALMDAHHNMNYFRDFVEAFRVWMANHGERNKPLLNTEFGSLFPHSYGISEAEVKDLLSATFDYMLTATDDDIGYPADENRLVQGWLWYSLNDDSWFHGDNRLFETPSKLMPIGEHWRDYVNDTNHPLASQPQRNLLVTNLRTDPASAFIPPGETITVTLIADVANSGNTSTNSDNNIMIKFWDGVPNGSNQIGDTQILDDFPGCGRGMATVEVEWPDRSPSDDNTWYVEVIPIGGETNEQDNVDSSSVPLFSGTAKITYLPIILK